MVNIVRVHLPRVGNLAIHVPFVACRYLVTPPALTIAGNVVAARSGKSMEFPDSLGGAAPAD